ncbi:MAG TPA: sigma-70 family RNA polymerase sigma factor [Polyangiaceae bacterium]
MKPAVVSEGSSPAEMFGAGFPGEVEVVREFAPRLRAIALRQLRDRSTTEDVVQEVLVSVVVALRERRIESPDRLPAYVLSACRRRIADVHRARARHAALSDELGSLDPAVVAPPRHAGERRLDLEQLVAAMSPLSGRERQVLSETYSGERSADEIAESIGTTAAHVRVLRHRALAKMRAALGWEDA